jgi:hypothetical protein
MLAVDFFHVDCAITLRDLMALFRTASKDENLAGVGCARSRLVRVNPS